MCKIVYDSFFLNNSKIPLGLIFVAHPVDEH